jgi:cephalosporin hydroxylase
VLLYTTDKIGHGYLPFYKRLADVINAGTNYPAVLEVGIGDGAGLLMFQDLFGPHAFVLGIDNQPSRVEHCRQLGLNAELGDQLDPEGLLPSVRRDKGLYDLIVDDAAHLGDHTQATLMALWPLVVPGGFYVIEDFNHLDDTVLGRVFDVIQPHKSGAWLLPGLASILIQPEGLVILQKSLQGR